MTARVVILLGAPGAGKGTQAVRLSRELSLPHISTGDLFRENISQNTPLGARAKTYMDDGKLVPDELVIEMLFDRVARPDCADGYVLDGFPRTLEQAATLERRLDDSARLCAVDIEVADGEIVERLAGRLVCRACGNPQHTRFAPPAKEGVCDACGGELARRDDDAPQVIQKRLNVYRAQTAPLIDYYRERGLLQSVDGRSEPDQVFGELTSAVTICITEGA